ncbi:MAG: hypothetical protein WDZ76_00755 [Pseudohongiellaceae bacterium]
MNRLLSFTAASRVLSLVPGKANRVIPIFVPFHLKVTIDKTPDQLSVFAETHEIRVIPVDFLSIMSAATVSFLNESCKSYEKGGDAQGGVMSGWPNRLK